MGSGCEWVIHREMPEYPNAYGLMINSSDKQRIAPTPKKASSEVDSRCGRQGALNGL